MKKKANKVFKNIIELVNIINLFLGKKLTD